MSRSRTVLEVSMNRSSSPERAAHDSANDLEAWMSSWSCSGVPGGASVSP
jgi:hypothetical protein